MWLFLWQGVTIQILSGRLQFFLRSIQTAFWPAAPLRRTSVLPQAKPWRRANSLRPSISITEGWSDQRERNPKENATCRNKSHFLLKPDFNLDIFDISEITSQFLKGTTCRFIVADHCWKSKCYSANAHLFVQSRQEYSIFAVVAALFS